MGLTAVSHDCNSCTHHALVTAFFVPSHFTYKYKLGEHLGCNLCACTSLLLCDPEKAFDQETLSRGVTSGVFPIIAALAHHIS